MGVCDEEGAFAGEQHEGAGITRGVRRRFMGRVRWFRACSECDRAGGAVDDEGTGLMAGLL